MADTILIVDDKEKLCKILAKDFGLVGYDALYATNGPDAVKVLISRRIHAVVLDLKLGDEDGILVLKDILACRPDTPVIIITGYGTIQTAVEAIRIGAFDYIQKPINFTKLQKTIENAVKLSRLHEENQNFKTRLAQVVPVIITESIQIHQLLQKLLKLAVTDYPILICGESGTGKELIADFVHASSNRVDRELYKINCASFPESLLDNELFGHERGAYTGAETKFPGVFERANKSSLFLDEFCDMPLPIQAKILRVLQSQELRRLGGKETIRVDVRFIAATNKDIREQVEKGLLREDLYYRLNTAMITIPPLRDRPQDIDALTDHFLSDFARRNDIEPKILNEAARGLLRRYRWPGNVRELKNTINYAATIAHGSFINIEDLPPSLLSADGDDLNKNPREEIEKRLILETLRTTNHNKKKTAELLKFSRRTLYNRLEKYGIG